MGGSKTAQPPDWITIYKIAQEFNLPPWEVEQSCTAKWYRRFIEYKMAESQEIERREKTRGKRGRRKN